MKACCLFNKTFPGTVTAWSLPKVQDTEREFARTCSPGVLGSRNRHLHCSFLYIKHMNIQTHRRGANLSVRPRSCWWVKGTFWFGVMLWECQCVGDGIIVWNKDSQQSPLSLSAGVWSVRWHWEKLKGRGWAGNSSQMRKGGEGTRTGEEKQRQRRLHTTCKCRLYIKLLVYVCICFERVAS